MGESYMEAFNTTNKNLIRTGVPRTDFFFNEIEMQKDKKRIEDTYTVMKNKKDILYAPTFRDNSNNDIMIDFEKLKASISDNYVLLIKHHTKSNTTLKIEL